MSHLDTNDSGSSQGFFRLPRSGFHKRSTCRVSPRGLIVKNHIQKRLMHPDAAVVFDKAVRSKLVHEVAYTGARGADHLGERLLADRRDERFGFAWLAKLRHQQQDAGQALLAGVEELIHQIGLDPHRAVEQKLEKEIGEAVLVMHDADHLVAVDLERGTRGDGGGGGHTQAGNARNRLFSNKVTGGEQRDGGFLAPFRDDGEFGTAGLQVENAVGRVSLREEGLLGTETDEAASQSTAGEEGGDVEHRIWNFGHDDRLCTDATARDRHSIVRRRVQFGIGTAWRNGLWPLELPDGLGTHTTHFPERRTS